MTSETQESSLFNRESALDYLFRRFGGSTGYVAMAVKLHNGAWIEYQYKWPNDVGKLISHLEKLWKADIYVCPVLRKDKGRDKWNGLSSRTVFADLDGGRIPDALLPFTELINSGTAGHYHAYITLTKPVSVEKLEALNYALTRASSGDPGKWANNTVLRLPGTHSYKRAPQAVSVAQLAEKPIDADLLQELLAEYMPNERTMARYATEDEINSLQEIAIPEKINWYLAQLMNEPAVGDRSGKSYHFLSACFEKGMRINLIYSLALKHPPTAEKFGGRKDGIKRQVLWVRDNANTKKFAFIESFLSWQDERRTNV